MEKTYTYNEIGNVYRKTREFNKLSQRDMAKKANVSPLSVFRIEHGNNASLSLLQKVAEGMGYDLKLQLTKRI